MKVHDIMSLYTIGDGENIVVDLEKSKGSYLVDKLTGKSYLDCSSQYASQPLGWNHPDLIAAESLLGSVAKHKIANSDFYTEHLAEFVSSFDTFTPDHPFKFFIEGGTLGVENALKAAFDWKSQLLGLKDEDSNLLDVVHLKEAFHGRSGYTLSLTNTASNKTALFPKFKWTRVINPKLKFPNSFGIEVIEKESIDQITHALKTKHVAAIIIEPIQSEGGDNHFRKEYLQSLRSLADQYKAMLIFDEVQTGIGMTGRLWAYDHFDLIPDMICFGKKTQVCGFCSTNRVNEVDSVFKVSSRINSTWGGNIVDMVRFNIIQKVIQKENLIENAAVVGNYFLSKLNELPRIKNVRGRGLLIAFDLENSTERDKTLDKMKTDMLALPAGELSVRLRPHLTFSKENVDEALNYIKNAILST